MQNAKCKMQKKHAPIPDFSLQTAARFLRCITIKCKIIGVFLRRVIARTDMCKNIYRRLGDALNRYGARRTWWMPCCFARCGCF